MERVVKILLFAILIFYSCSRGGDIFAVINGENITRQEFNDWLESRDIPVKSVYKDKYTMNDYLKQIAVEKVTVSRAEGSGYNRDKIYKTVENTLYKNLLSTFYSGKIREEVTFNENAVDISIIRLIINKDVKNHHNEEENKRIVLNNIINELKAGKDFNDLAAKYSEDAAAKKKGHLGIVPEFVLEDNIKSVLSSIKENEYTLEPVISGKSLCLIKLHRRYMLNEKNIFDIVKEKTNADRIIDFYKNRSLDQNYNDIVKESKAFSKIETAGFSRRDEVIFSINGDSFTSGELDDILRLFRLLKFGVISTDNFSIQEKKITSEKIFRERLFASEAEKKSMDKDPEFMRNWFYLKRATLAGTYKYNLLQQKIKITKNDIWEEYVKNRNTKYYRIKKINNKEEKIPLPFLESEKMINNLLSREKLKSLKKEWDNGIIDEGNYKIVSKDFSID